jgi:hypothetical protein
MSGAAVIGHSLTAFGFDAQISNTSNTSAVKVEKDVVVGKGGDARGSKDLPTVIFHGLFGCAPGRGRGAA